MKITADLTRAQMAAIMAGLRLLELHDYGHLNAQTMNDAADIASDGGNLEPIAAPAIAELARSIDRSRRV